MIDIVMIHFGSHHTNNPAQTVEKKKEKNMKCQETNLRKIENPIRKIPNSAFRQIPKSFPSSNHTQ